MKHAIVLFLGVLGFALSAIAQAVEADRLSDRAAFWWQAGSLDAGPKVNGHPSAPAATVRIPDLFLGSGALSVFTVYVPDQNVEEQLLWSLSSAGAVHTVLTTHRLAQIQRGDYRNFQDTAWVPARLHSYYARLAEEELQLSILPIVPANLPVVGFGGSLAEVIVFDAVLSPLERQRVETYLALKYGLTLATDYLDRRGAIVQPILEGEHVWRVAGLGEDSFFSFRQNQSHSIFAPTLLALRSENEVEPGSFLVVADDDAPLELHKPAALQPLTSQRSWQLTATRWSTENSLQLEVDTSAFAKTAQPNHHWWIRQEAGGLPSPYAAMKLGRGGCPTFELSIPTSSGASTFQVVYGLALLPNVELSAPNCASNSKGEVRIAAAALHFPVSYTLFDDLNFRLASGVLSGAEDAHLVQLPAGDYRLEMEDALGTRFSESWFFQASDAPAFDLETAYLVADVEAFQLDPKVSTQTTVEWRSAAGELLSTNSVFETSTFGDFELRAYQAGCESRHAFTVARLRNSDNIKDLQLWPNPSTDGYFQLSVDLHQAATAQVEIVDVAGRVLHRQTLPAATTRHTFQGRVLHKGMYFVRFETRASAEVRGLVVE